MDVVEVDRLESSIQQFGSRFLEWIFTADEIHYCSHKSHAATHFAARFAAKEAVAKALGTGIGQHASWLDIEVVRSPQGAPMIALTGNARQFCQANQIAEIKITLTHTKSYAAASAIALGRTQGI